MSEEHPGQPAEPPKRKRRKRKRRRRGAAAEVATTRAGRGSKTTTQKQAKASGRKQIPTKTEVSAGGVVYRRTDADDVEFVLAARRTRRGELAWGLAKGGIEPEESIEDAAVREVREETGLEAEIETSLGDTKYVYVWEDVRIRKTVHFFLMRFRAGNPADHDDEMEDVRWFPMGRAIKRATYKGEREVLQRAADLLR